MDSTTDAQNGMTAPGGTTAPSNTATPGNTTAPDSAGVSGAGPPAGWRLLIWAMLAAAAAFLVTCVLRIVQLRGDHALLAGLRSSPDSGTGFRVTSAEHVTAAWHEWLWWLLLFVAAVWFLQVSSAAKLYGSAGRAALAHWTNRLWLVVVPISLVLTVTLRGAAPRDTASLPDVLNADLHNVTVLLVYVVLRTVMAGALILVVWIRYTRMRALAATGVDGGARPVPSA